MKKQKLYFVLLCIIILLCGCGFGTQIERFAQAPKVNSSLQAPLEVHFIDVGQGDSILITCEGESMLIDAGDNNQGTKVQNYLNHRNVDHLKYAIGTHPDADHIGGLDVILYKYDCDTVIMPRMTKDTATYRDVEEVLRQKAYKITYPEVGNQYALGSASFTILSPAKEYEDANNNSVVILFQYGENSFLFVADAEEQAEYDILNAGISIKADVLKVGHHGSRSSSTESFLDAVSPTYAVISCAEGNDYGHPHAQTLDRLRTRGIQLFRTDEQGSIIAASDGKHITWNCAPTQSWQSGEPTQHALPQNITYILNTNSHKFHLPDCKSVNDMSSKNKKEVSLTRDEILSQGYEPCKNCKP